MRKYRNLDRDWRSLLFLNTWLWDRFKYFLSPEWVDFVSVFACTGALYSHLCRACKESILTGRICVCSQYYYCGCNLVHYSDGDIQDWSKIIKSYKGRLKKRMEPIIEFENFTFKYRLQMEPTLRISI